MFTDINFYLGFIFCSFALLVQSFLPYDLELPEPPPPYVIIIDYGGNVNDYAADVLRRYTLRQEIIIEEKCYSACTMYLGSPYTCTYDDTEFYFHGPSSVNPVPEEKVNEARAIMAMNYGGDLYDWFWENAAMLHGSDQFEMLTGKQLNEMGAVKICS